MQDCQVCGRRFDPRGFQVVVPELGRGFDRIECAETARAVSSPGSRIAAAPLVAVVEPLSALVPAARPAPALRSFGPPVAALGLLAAGTAAAAFLWLRVLGTDTTSFPLTRTPTPAAVAGETVEAHVQRAVEKSGVPAKTPAERPVPTATATLVVAGEPVAPAPDTGGTKTSPPAVVAPDTGGTKTSPPAVVRPARSSPTRSDGAKTSGRGNDHAKQGRGQGHIKHGDTLATHTPGHGQARAHGAGHGGGRGHGAGGHGSGSHGGAHGHGKKH